MRLRRSARASRAFFLLSRSSLGMAVASASVCATPGLSRIRVRTASSSTARAVELDAVLTRMRESPGVAHTEALATAIPRLERESKKKARDALAERLSRMRAASLAAYLKDEDSEIRRGAALGLAMKENKEHLAELID